MKSIHIGMLSLLLAFTAENVNSQTKHNVSLDKNQPIELLGNTVKYSGTTIQLGPKSILLDGALTNDEADKSPYVFNDFKKAAAAFIDGTEGEPMTLYVAPYVYWVDNPDDSAVRVGSGGREPFGIIIKCNYLHLIGLNSDAENVVFAANRGQTQGAIGNFTMFDFWGDGLFVKNMTLGNFCNVDLDYKLDSKLSRPKRMSAITQAHVAYCHGDKIFADNVRFISRLNMNPLNGANRILYNNCHMESTDDALTGTGVYLNCTLDFYGQKPFWRSDMGGAIFINSDMSICHDEYEQYFCKSVGPLSIIDSRFHSSKPVYVGWTNTPMDWLRCYQSDVTLNDSKYVIGGEKLANTITITNKPALNAYRINDGDSVVYNIYNLVCGNDGWDPLHQRETIERLSKRDGRDYSAIATCLSVEPLEASMQTGDSGIKLVAAVKRHCNYVLNNNVVHWKTLGDGDKYVRLSTRDGFECVAEAINHSDSTRTVNVLAYTDDGLECASVITVAPDFVAAPAFVKKPKIKIENGNAVVKYVLDLNGRDDESLITWYRCSDKKGNNRIPVAVSRLNNPNQVYRLSKADVGYYLMVTVAPKHLRCMPGEDETSITTSAVKVKDVVDNATLETDFVNFPVYDQPLVKPGFWTVGGYKPADTAEFDWKNDSGDEYWNYGYGLNGTQGTGLIQIRRGARILYTPVDGKYGDMEETWLVDPAKTAGQGFGSATGQYMDVYIKFDTKTLTGYALRIIRTTKYSNAVDFLLVKYDNGIVTEITPAVSSICYRTGCTINLKFVGDKLTAHVNTVTKLSKPNDSNLKSEVDLEATVAPNDFGGLGIQHTGTCGESITMLHHLKASWK